MDSISFVEQKSWRFGIVFIDDSQSPIDDQKTETKFVRVHIELEYAFDDMERSLRFAGDFLKHGLNSRIQVSFSLHLQPQFHRPADVLGYVMWDDEWRSVFDEHDEPNDVTRP